jgi:hypothetical protein
MKKVLLPILFIASAIGSKAQLQMYGGLEDVYRNFMVQSHSQFNKGVLNDFLGMGGDKRFMHNLWIIGGATNNFGVTISGDYYFNFDFLGHELHAKWKDTTIIVNTNYIKRFFLLNENVIHTFVKSPAIDPPGKYFFESLGFAEEKADSPGVQLLKLRTIKVIKANKNDYLANFSGDYSDKLDNNIDYYIVMPDNSFTKVKLNKRSLGAALVNYKDKVDQFFKANSNVTEATAGDLIRFINQ